MPTHASPRSPFARGLSDPFLAALLDGPAGQLLRACIDHDLDIRLRDDYLNAYSQGRSLARLSRGTRQGPQLEIHHKYLEGHQLETCPGARSGHYVRFTVDGPLARAYRNELPRMLARATAFEGPEERWEYGVARANGASTPLWLLDRQVDFPGLPRLRIDAVALARRDGVPCLVATELKRQLDNRIQEVPAQVLRYMEMLDPDGQGLRADVARAYQRVCAQLTRLGLPAPAPGLITPGMPVEGLLVLADYTPRSQLLQRAHDLAATMPRAIHFCQIDLRDLTLPGPDGWTRLGAPRMP